MLLQFDRSHLNYRQLAAVARNMKLPNATGDDLSQLDAQTNHET